MQEPWFQAFNVVLYIVEDVLNRTTEETMFKFVQVR